MTTVDELLVSEIFGPTFQGEGPALGQRAVFLRLAGCPVRCSWCDTTYSWDKDDPAWSARGMTSGEVALDLRHRLAPGDLLVVTGGEPLVQQRAILRLVREPLLSSCRFHLETSGVVVPHDDLVTSFELIVVSPKLSNAGETALRRFSNAALTAFASAQNVWFKFVAQDSCDLEEIADVVERFGIQRVMVMPEGTEADVSMRVARGVADDVIARGWSLTPRLHILLWGDQRGR